MTASARCNERAEMLRRENDLFVQRRVDNLVLWSNRRIRHNELLAETQTDERVKRMYAGKIAVEEARLTGLVADAQEKRVTNSSTIHAAIFAEIQR